jgi:hypothetical protein
MYAYNTADSDVVPKDDVVFSCSLDQDTESNRKPENTTSATRFGHIEAWYVGSTERKKHQDFIRINVTTFSTRKHSNSVSSWLFELISQITVQNQIFRESVRRLFLFLPRKENQTIRILLIREVLSPCVMGWGPPLQIKSKGGHAKLEYFWSRSVYFLTRKFARALQRAK